MSFPPAQTNTSLLNRYLTPEIFNELKHLQTKAGFSLNQAIESGLKNPDSTIGIYAGDGESYGLFLKVFKPIIETYHKVLIDRLHPSDLNPMDDGSTIPLSHAILSYRIRIARNLAGFAFPPLMDDMDRTGVEELAVNALLKLKGDLKGSYIPLGELTESQRAALAAEHLLFGRGDRFMEAAGINRNWPASRGIFVSKDHRFAVWINEEDHLRIISLDRPGTHRTTDGIKKTYNRLAQAMAHLEQNLKFAKDPLLGYLTSCPSNLGTGMRAGVHICLPGFKTWKKKIVETADRYQLQIRGSHGEKTGVKENVVDISNRHRLGITEKKCIETLEQGLCAILADRRFTG
ncbi:MAG: phosphagen kinase [Desulfobacterium sp.]|jgi:creatine kinase/arginine kinase|nr:phosphagen kinase [Desulfobacterium sp.]